ncbi:MAG: glycosyltransferase [Chitinophagaceae bacterium]
MKFTGERFVPADSLLEDEIGYEHLHRYYAVSGLVKNKAVLDLACGEGYGSAIVAKHAASVAGVDIDEESIKWATEKYAPLHVNLQFSPGSAVAIPFASQTFDVVISFETIEHLNPAMQEAFMQEIKRVLRSDGILIMSTPDKKNYSDRYKHENTFHIKEFYREEFAAFIKNNFTNAAFFDQGYEVVSVISNPETEKATAINLHSWKERKQPTERKYMIAVASDSPLPDYASSLSSIVPEVDKNFPFLMDRLIQMNKEIEDLGQWGKTLDVNVQDTRKMLKEKELLAAELHEKLLRLYQENNKTNERLAEIYDSDGWRLLNRYYKLKGKMLPEHSNRYKKLKKIYNQLRFRKTKHPAPIENIEKNSRHLLKEILSINFEVFTLPEFEYPAVSIIIPAHNAWEMNYQCINSIANNTSGIAYEVILADDGSADDTKSCTNFINNLVHVRSKENLGFLKNCNYAAGFAKGKHILFLNNDTKVNPNWLTPLVGLMESDDTIGMVGSKLIYPDGSLQEAGGIIWNDASGWNYGNRKDPQLPEFNYVKEVDYISGAAILIRKKVWLESGGFDERYSPAYSEDADFAFTLRSMGYKVMYQPLSEVMHYEGYSHGTSETLSENTDAIKSYQKINNSRLFEKWQQVLTKEQLPNGQNVFQARDRTINKKTMLVIDHYVPHFDKDAGSKTTFQYLELFASLGLNIKFIGDNFFKHEPYTTALQQMGVEVLYGAWYRDNWQQWIKDNNEHIDYIYLNRPHISIKYIDFLKQFTKARILYYGHDLHFRREEMQYEIEKDPKLLKSARKLKQVESYLFENSDIILTPSREENDIIRALNSSFRVETILPYFFKKQAQPVADFSQRAGIIFVGGFTHLPNLDAVEWFCRDVWPLVTGQLTGAKFIVVGSNPPDVIKELQSDSIEIKGFVSETELQKLYDAVKLAVIPLRYGAGVKGKTIEAMYYGLPIVSTGFGIEGMPGDYLHFLHPLNEPQEFANEIIRLYKDENALQALSLEETNYINTNFTQQTAAVKMQDMLGLNGKM